MAGVTTAGLYFVRFLLSAMVAASPTGRSLERQRACRRFGRLVWRFSRPLSRRFRGQGRAVPKDFDVCTKIGSSRIVRNLVSQRVVSRGESVSSRARRRVFAFLVQGGSARFLFLHRLPGHTGVCTTAFWPQAGKRSCAQSGCWRQKSWRKPEAPRPLALSRATWCLLLAPMWSRRSLVALLTRERSKGALRGCCGTESCQVVWVFTSFSPDGLELGQGRP